MANGTSTPTIAIKTVSKNSYTIHCHYRNYFGGFFSGIHCGSSRNNGYASRDTRYFSCNKIYNGNIGIATGPSYGLSRSIGNGNGSH